MQDPAAKTDPSVTGATTPMTYASDDERSFWDINRPMLGGFFTDNSMSTMKSKAEAREAFAALGADDRASIKKACDTAMQNRGSYGTVTTSLCTQVGEM
jgi:hypothetical protein